MKKLINNPGKTNRKTGVRLAFVVLGSLFLFACQKEAILSVGDMSNSE